MDILVIGKFYPEGKALHIAETLKKMGHRTLQYEPGLSTETVPEGRFRKRWHQFKTRLYDVGNQIPAVRTWQRRSLWERLRNQNIDLTLVCHDSFLWPKEVDQLQALTEGPVALWFPDAISNLDRGHCVTAPYDALFFKDPYIVRRLDDLCRAPVYYLPQCFNPDRHALAPGTQEEDLASYRCDVTTAGNLYSFRVGFFRRLSEYDVKIWGHPAPHWLDPGPVGDMFQEHYVCYEEKAKAFRAAKVVLNNLHPAEIWGVNKRTFEAAGIGAFQMMNWRPGLSQLFSVGEEVVTFQEEEDLKEKLDYYLDHRDEREAIAEKGKKRAINDHTYEDRLACLINTVQGEKKGHPLPSECNAKKPNDHRP